MYIKTSLEGLNKNTLPLISTAGDTLEDEVNAVSKHFERISSSGHYSTEFFHHKISVFTARKHHAMVIILH